MFAKTNKNGKVHIVEEEHWPGYEREGFSGDMLRFPCISCGWYGNENVYAIEKCIVVENPSEKEMCKTCIKMKMKEENMLYTFTTEMMQDGSFKVLDGPFSGSILKIQETSK